MLPVKVRVETSLAQVELTAGVTLVALATDRRRVARPAAEAVVQVLLLSLEQQVVAVLLVEHLKCAELLATQWTR